MYGALAMLKRTEETTYAPASSPPLDHAAIRAIVVGIMLAAFLSALEQTIVAPALPTMGPAEPALQGRRVRVRLHQPRGPLVALGEHLRRTRCCATPASPTGTSARSRSSCAGARNVRNSRPKEVAAPPCAMVELTVAAVDHFDAPRGRGGAPAAGIARAGRPRGAARVRARAPRPQPDRRDRARTCARPPPLPTRRSKCPAGAVHLDRGLCCGCWLRAVPGLRCVTNRSSPSLH